MNPTSRKHTLSILALVGALASGCGATETELALDDVVLEGDGSKADSLFRKKLTPLVSRQLHMDGDQVATNSVSVVSQTSNSITLHGPLYVLPRSAGERVEVYTNEASMGFLFFVRPAGQEAWGNPVALPSSLPGHPLINYFNSITIDGDVVHFTSPFFGALPTSVAFDRLEQPGDIGIFSVPASSGWGKFASSYNTVIVASCNSAPCS